MKQKSNMELWFFAGTPFGFQPQLLPRSQVQWTPQCLSEPADGNIDARKWERGVSLELTQLPWTFVLARPAGLSRGPEHSPKSNANLIVSLRFHFCTDNSAREPLAPAEDGIGLMSLFAEYVQMLTMVFDSLRIPISALAPTQSGVVLELPKVEKASGDDSSARIERILLASASADWLARGRGFRVRDVQCILSQGERQELNGSWLEP